MPVLMLNDFSGGLNNRFRQNRILDNQFSRIRNIRYTLQGALTKRLSTSRIAVQVGGINIGNLCGLFAYQFNTMANEQLLIADVNGRIVRTTDVVSFADQVTGLSTTYEPNFSAINRKVYLTNGADAVRSIDASNVNATPTGPPRSRYLCAHQGYLFYFNDPVTPNFSRLQWSNQNDGDTYVSSNFQDIYPSDGGFGSGLISFGSELILFKGPFYTNMGYANSSMYRVIGDVFDASNPTYAIEKIPLPTNVGVVHGKTAAILDGWLIFATNDGFYAYAGGGRPPERISEVIRGDILNWELRDVHAIARRAAGTVFNGRYYCSLYTTMDSSDAYNNRLYIYDEGKWYVDIISSDSDTFAAGGSTGNCWAQYQARLYLGSAGFPILRQYEVSGQFTDTQDGGTAVNINASALTKEYDLGDEVLFEDAYIHLRRQTAGTLTFGVNVNQRGEAVTSISMTAPDTGSSDSALSRVLRKQVAIQTHGRTIQFRFFDSGNNDMEIYAIELHYAKKGWTRQIQ